MKICVYGLGAIGGLFAAKLAAAGHSISAVARGSTLQAVRQHGLRIENAASQGEYASYPVHADEDPSKLGPQDVVIISVKTTALGNIAEKIKPLLGANTTVVSAMNGIPWWFFHGLNGAPAGLKLESVDPQGCISTAIPAHHVVGCVTHLAATTPEPGVVRQVAGNALILGEPSGTSSPRLQAISNAFDTAGFDTTATDSIQREIWFKLWGNMTMNPMSAITGATGDRILDDIYVRNFLSHAMLEAAAIGAAIGLPIAVAPEERHAVTRKLGAFRTSMLQDAEAGRMLELDALIAAVIEIGQQVQVATPWIESLFGVARLQARVRGLYPA